MPLNPFFAWFSGLNFRFCGEGAGNWRGDKQSLLLLGFLYKAQATWRYFISIVHILKINCCKDSIIWFGLKPKTILKLLQCQKNTKTKIVWKWSVVIIWIIIFFFGLSNVLTVMQLLLSFNINYTLVILWSLFCYLTNIGFVIFTAREELLTEHALQWNRRKVEHLPQSLAKRYKKVWNDNFKFCNTEIIICLVVATVGSRI